MLVEGLKADQHFQEQLKALTDAQLKQLWETERTRCEELEKRIHRDSLLSTDKEDKSGENLNVDTVFNPSRQGAFWRRPTITKTFPILPCLGHFPYWHHS
ncbi:unnamed protein product [Merluccius merluccius]